MNPPTSTDVNTNIDKDTNRQRLKQTQAHRICPHSFTQARNRQIQSYDTLTYTCTDTVQTNADKHTNRQKPTLTKNTHNQFSQFHNTRT